MGQNKDHPEDYRIVPEDAPYEEGFNMKTLWAALFVGIVMMPGAIYLGLIMGQGLGGAAQWVTIILFVEITKRAFVRLRTQEIIIIYWIAGGLVAFGGLKLGSAATMFGGPFAGMIWDQYFVNSPPAESLRYPVNYIPSWLAPTPGSWVYDTRSFLHKEWVLPIIVLVITQILFLVNFLSLGYVLFRVTSDVEKLSFPMAPVTAGGATALAETSGKREGWRWRVFSIGSIIGVIYGLIYIVVPTLSNILLVRPVQILPIPWVDFTIYLKSVLPAAPLAFATDLGALLAGFVLPFWVVVGMFVGQICRILIANPILYHVGILQRWTPGMTYIPTLISNNLDFWLSFSIGLGVIIALIGMGSVAWAFLKRKKTGSRKPVRTVLPEGRGDIKIVYALLFWAASTLGFVFLVHFLVPEFPIWIALFFGFIITPLGSYITARMIGIVGMPQGSVFPFLREGMFFLSGYKGAAIWFAPMPLFYHGGVTQTFKQLELTKTKFGSYVKMATMSLGIMLVCSFVFWSLIWKLGEIPSAAYPFTQKVWPYNATMQALWASSTIEGGSQIMKGVIKIENIIAGLSIGGVVYLIFAIFRVPLLLFYGIVGGVTAGVIPGVIPTFIGGLLSRYYFVKRFGTQRWRAFAPILLAGYGCGVGLVGMASIAIALIAKSISQVVF